MVSASIPGPARPRSIGSSAGSAISTRVGPSASRVFGTNFGRIISTTTAEAGRRSMTSLTSAPMRSNCIEPLALHVERDELDLDARQVVRQGLRPVGGRRAWARMGWTGGAVRDARRRAASRAARA